MDATEADAAAELSRYEGYLARDPDNLNLTLEVADRCLRQGHIDAARELLKSALQRWPNHAALLFRLASAAMAAGEPDAAVSVLQGLLDAGTDDPGVRYNLAYALMFTGRYAEARTWLATLVDRPDHLPEADLLMARALHHLGEYEPAIAHAQRYAAARPDDADAAAALSLLYLDTGRYDQAAHYAREALQARPDALEALITQGTLELNQQGAPREYFERATARYPASGRAWSGMGLTDMQSLRFDAALEDFRKAVHYLPGHIGTWHALAWCQMLLGDFAAAEQNLQQALAIDDTFGETHGGLAVVAVAQGRSAEAEMLITKALRLNRDGFAARYARTLLLERAGKPEEAQRILEKIFTSSAIAGGPSLREVLTRQMQSRPRGKVP